MFQIIKSIIIEVMEYFPLDLSTNSSQQFRSNIITEIAKIDHYLHFLNHIAQKHRNSNLFTQYSQDYGIRLQRIITYSEVNPKNFNFWKHQVQTKYNWVDDFLNDNDVTILGVDTKKNLVQIKAYEDSSKSFIVQQQTKNLRSMINSRLLHEKNQKLLLFFKKHNYLYKIDKQIAQVELTESTRLILCVENSNKSELRRIIILKQNQQGKFIYLEGKYDDRNFKYPVKLQSGRYILFSAGVEQQFSILASKEVLIKSDKVSNLQIYNLFIGGFHECFESQNRKDVEFMRVNYMDIGLVIEVYSNIYDYSVQLLDKFQRQQDKIAIFPQLYRPDFISKKKLLPKQKIMLFHFLTKKPAKLYLPQKKILSDKKEIQCLSIHTISK